MKFSLMTALKFVLKFREMKFDYLYVIAFMAFTSIGAFAESSKCPSDLTKLEQDGLYSVETSGEGRFKVLSHCGLDSRKDKLKKVNDIQLKTSTCKCFIGNWERYTPLGVDKKYSFKVSKSEATEDCWEGSHFIICKKPGECYEPDPKYSECSMPKYNYLACPKECLKWHVL